MYSLFDLSILLIAFVISALLGIIVYRNNPKSKTNIIFSILAWDTSIWMVVNHFALGATNSVMISLWLSRFSIFFAVPQIVAVFLLSHTLPRENISINRKILISILIASLVMMLINISPFAFTGVAINNGSLQPIPGIGMGIFALFAISLSINALYTFIKRYKASTGIEKRQLYFIIMGISIMFSFIILTILLPVAIFKSTFFVPFSSLYVLVFLFLTAYSIVRHHFFDIRILVARTVFYTITIFIVVSGYVLLLFTLAAIIPELQVSTKQIIAFSTISIVIFFTSGTIQKIIQEVTNNIFFQGRYDPEILLSSLTHIMAEELDIKRLSQRLLSTLNGQMRLIASSFIVIDKDKKQVQIEEDKGVKHFNLTDIELEKLMLSKDILIFEELVESDEKRILREHNISIFIILKTKESKIGFLILGPKASGEIYSGGDINVIEIFGSQAAIALQNSLAYLEIKEFNRTLEKKVDERTEELEQSQKRELSKAKELLKLKDEFVFIATHDLKTPVTAIDGYISLIESEKPKFSANIKENFGEVKAASGRLKQLVNDLLQVARGESGTIKIDVTSIDLNKIINKVVSEVKPLAQEKKVKLMTNFDKSTKQIMGDEFKLPEIIENLLSNAIKFNHPDGSVTITTKKLGSMLETSVSDTGFGIPKDEQTKVFEKFFKYRGDKTRD